MFDTSPFYEISNFANGLRVNQSNFANGFISVCPILCSASVSYFIFNSNLLELLGSSIIGDIINLSIMSCSQRLISNMRQLFNHLINIFTSSSLSIISCVVCLDIQKYLDTSSRGNLPFEIIYFAILLISIQYNIWIFKSFLY